MEPYAEEVKTALGEKVYESGRVNGELYGIGRLLDQASTTCYNLRRDIAEEFGYKNGDKVDLAELTELFGKVREKYPDTPLKELGTYLDPPVGKSGVNHRLRRISEIADELREKE